MEEESEKNLLTTDKEVVEEQKGEENATNEETLLEPNNTEQEEEKRPSPKTRFFKLFERKKISSSESTECPLKEHESKRQRPSLSGLFNKFRRGKYDVTDNIELGDTKNEPKAGLASMETLDDSIKDPWTETDGNNGTEAVKLTKEEEAAQEREKVAEEQEKPIPIWQQIREYNCSIDDIALLVGILIFFCLVGLIILFTLSGNTKVSTSAPIRSGKVLAVTSCGYVEGLLQDSALAFRGIPYAKKPIGSLRFEAAQPIDNLDDCWNGTLLAHNSSETCLQKNDKGEIIGSEDCLYMDIVTPEVRYINLLPVIVLVGTNNYANGTPGILRPSAKYARSRSVVYVRPNFRMGVLGFLALESLSNSSAIPSSGNYALTDLIAALEWIKINIQHFGGDPKSVTIFGHRTGATLATALTAIPKANKLFSGVWASSGSFRLPGDPLEVFEKNNLEYAGLYPTIKDKSAWQEIDALELVNKTPSTWTKEHIGNLPTYYENSSDFHDWIVQDGVYLKEHPVDVWKSSKNIPKIVIGTTAHAAFDISKDSFLSKNLTEEEIVTYVKDSKIGRLNLTEEAFKRYGKTREGLISMISDIRVVCPLLTQARSQDNIAFYVVTQKQAHGDLNLADVDSDVQAILGRYTSDTPEKRRYFDSMMHLFHHFVYHGKVNHFNQQKPILEIGQDVAQRSDYPNCDFWISSQVVPHFAAYY